MLFSEQVSCGERRCIGSDINMVVASRNSSHAPFDCLSSFLAHTTNDMSPSWAELETISCAAIHVLASIG